MEGYEVLSYDGEPAGKVVGTSGEYLIVERGALFKRRRPVPQVFATRDDDACVILTTLSRELLESAPSLDGDAVDEHAAARHYGLTAGEEAPETLGYGDVAPGDPAWSAERQEAREGLEPAAQERARIREGLGPR